jgi:flagellar biosynthesis/type III secretory pathway chaperone
MSRSDTSAQRLLALLAAERKALLAGELAALPDFVVAKERLTAALSSAPPEAGELVRLRVAAASNQALLEAALRGVKAARARIDAARSGGAALSTYDARGKSSTWGTGGSSFERRA